MAGCKSRFPSNKFNFLRLRRVTGATLSDLPITELCPIVLFIPQPSNLQSVAISDSQINLTWDSVLGVDSYNIYRSDTSGSGYVFIGNSTNALFNDSGLNPDTQYFYIVRSVISGQESDDSNESSATTFFAFLFTTQKQPSINNIFEPSIVYSGVDPVWIFENGYEFVGQDLSLLNDEDGSINGLNGTPQIVKLVVEDKSLISQFNSNGDDLVGVLDFSVFDTASFDQLRIIGNSSVTEVNFDTTYVDGVDIEVRGNSILSVLILNTTDSSIVSSLIIRQNNLSQVIRGNLVYQDTFIDIGQNNFTDFDFAIGDSLTTLDMADNNFSSVPANMASLDFSGNRTRLDYANNSFDPPTPLNTITGQIERIDLRNTGKTGVFDLSAVPFRTTSTIELFVTNTLITGMVNPDLTALSSYLLNYQVGDNPNWNQAVFDLTTLRIGNIASERSRINISNMPLLTSITRFINVTGFLNSCVISNLGISSIPFVGYQTEGQTFLFLNGGDNPNLVNFEFGTQTAQYRSIEFENNPNIDKDDIVSFINGLLTVPIFSTTGHSIDFSNDGLTTAQVNEILVTAAARFTLTTSNPVFNIAGGSNAAPDGSSGGFDGLTAVADLVALGYTVLTN